jgi:hypothetical protein
VGIVRPLRATTPPLAGGVVFFVTLKAADIYARHHVSSAGTPKGAHAVKNIVTKTYLLIDLENRQPAPEHVAAWMGQDGEAWIFYGEQQINLLPNYWQLGDQVSIVPISRAGKNSLDFHLVLYLGYPVAKRKKGSRFVIVAADADYDPAVAHARAEGIDVVRLPELTMVVRPNDEPTSEAVPTPAAKSRSPGPLARNAASAKSPATADREPAKTPNKTTTSIYAGILKDIRGPNRPGDLKALTSRIQSRIGQAAAPERVTEVMARLATMDVIQVINGELNYLAKASDEDGSRV